MLLLLTVVVMVVVVVGAARSPKPPRLIINIMYPSVDDGRNALAWERVIKNSVSLSGKYVI